MQLYLYKDIRSIQDWRDWLAKRRAPYQIIQNYWPHKEITFDGLIQTAQEITFDRCWNEVPRYYESWDNYHDYYRTARGPDGLLRLQLGYHACIGYDGKIDLIDMDSQDIPF